MLREILESPEIGQKGLISMAKLAVKIAKVVYCVATRFLEKRDHGLYATIEEEILRSFYVDKIGKLLFWDQMKKDTADAFEDDLILGREPGGRAFLTQLAVKVNNGMPIPRISLIGHSTGAIYICNFIKTAAILLPDSVKFDIVLLAPASDFTLFQETMTNHSKRIEGVRLFGMQDETEKADPMAQDVPALKHFARWIYPHSLLYFVSGLLESEVDHPILGMQRFYNLDDAFDTVRYPQVDWARKYFSKYPQPDAVWSIKNLGPGRSSASEKHGDFDNDEETVKSIEWILRKGYA